jgi:molecular chaperone DnaJ
VKRDYYEVLEISREASDQEIKSAYRKLAMKHHPDRNPGNREAEELFKEASEAYSVLGDREKRSLYDRFGHSGVGSSASSGGFYGMNPDLFADFGDILGNFFFGESLGGSGRRRRSGPVRGADLQVHLQITLEESITGAEKEVKVAARRAVKNAVEAVPIRKKAELPAVRAMDMVRCDTVRDSLPSPEPVRIVRVPGRS